MNLSNLTALELGKKIQSKEISVWEAVTASLDAIQQKEHELNCFIAFDESQAKKRASEAQKDIDRGVLASPLAGVPMAVKDNLCVEQFYATCGSKMLEHFMPPYTASAVRALLQQGAVLLGKTNMDEFAMGSSTETSYFGATKNPRNAAYVSGGSSGGSCAAVAAGECFYALGTDTGGSIRQPCAYCGVTGIKPTYGTVSRYGLIAYASSMDQIGPIAKDVSDCAAILEVISFFDKKDSTSIRRGALDFTSALVDNVEGMKIGIPMNCFGSGLDREVRDAILSAVSLWKQKGAQIEAFDFQYMDYAVAAYYVIACAQASSNLARFDGVKYGYRAKTYDGLNEMYEKSRSEGFGEEVKRRLLLGAFALSEGYYDAYYIKALKTRTLIKRGFDELFSRFDVLLSPAAFTAAPKIGESLKNPVGMYQSDAYTVSANLAGLPALCLPCGKTKDGRPIGIQLTGDLFMEKKILRAAYAFEQIRKEQKQCKIDTKQS